MGGRYLLIEFDDETTASRLREQINAASAKGKGYRVIGLFARPARFCRCGKWESTRQLPAPTKRGPKFGWYVCTQCKRPVPSMSFLRNLLAPKDVVAPYFHDSIDDKGQERKLGFHPIGLTLPSVDSSKYEGN